MSAKFPRGGGGGAGPFLARSLGCLQFVIVVFPDHTHLLFFIVED